MNPKLILRLHLNFLPEKLYKKGARIVYEA